MLVRIFSTFIFIFLNFQISWCQDAESAKYPFTNDFTDSTKKILPTDDEFTVNVRLVPNSIIDEYKNDSEFDYDGGPKEAEDWITKIKNWINQQLIILSSSKTYSTILDFFYYGLIIIALILIVRGLIKADRRGLLFGKIKSDELKITELQEDVSKMNFDDLISLAVESKNYKLTIRYLFLKSLQMLSEKEIIELRDNKTNYQYLYEIKNNQIANAFRTTTSRFEWIWYGDFPVNEEVMKSSRNDFNVLFGLITS